MMVGSKPTKIFATHEDVESATPYTIATRGRWRRVTLAAIACSLLLVVNGCRRVPPIVSFETIPIASIGGADTKDVIRGRVQNYGPKDRIVLYAQVGPRWWVQPSASAPFTEIRGDGTWSAQIHLGAEYAALVVAPSFKPKTVIEQLPSAPKTVRAITIVPGKQSISESGEFTGKMLHFGGYDWEVQAAPGGYGGKDHYYSRENLWIAQDGSLHLRLSKSSTKSDNQWVCAEAHTVRALGYGNYRFALRDIGKLPSAAMFSLFVRSKGSPNSASSEMDVHISRWGNVESSNAEYVVQPYYLPENGFRFEMPSGKLTTGLQWSRERASFETTSQRDAKTGPVATHTFSAGVPLFTGQHAYVNLCEFSYARKKLDEGAEVVVENFEFLP